MGEFRRSRAPLQPADLAESFLGFVHRLACCIGQIYRELTKICQMAQALWRPQNVTHTHSQLPQTFLQGGCQVHAGEQLAVLPLCHASGLCFDANLPCFCAHACAACSLLQLLQPARMTQQLLDISVLLLQPLQTVCLHIKFEMMKIFCFLCF